MIFLIYAVRFATIFYSFINKIRQNDNITSFFDANKIPIVEYLILKKNHKNYISQFLI